MEVKIGATIKSFIFPWNGQKVIQVTQGESTRILRFVTIKLVAVSRAVV